MYTIKQKHTKHTAKTYKTYSKNIQNIQQKHTKHTSKTYKTYSKNIQNIQFYRLIWEVRAVPRLCDLYYLAFVLKLRKRHGKTSVRLLKPHQFCIQMLM
jgi:hypothetical protein